MSLLDDRFTRGFLAGLMGCIPSTIFNQAMYALKISKLRYLDFAAIFVYGQKSTGTFEDIFAALITIFFTSALGIIFTFVIAAITTQNIVFKGLLFSAGSWFLIYSVVVLFKIPEVSKVDLLTAISNLIGSMIWGISLVYSLLWIKKKQKMQSI